MTKKNLYTKDSIESLNPREHVRLRPGVYAGDTSNPNQLLMEVFANALDEHNIGHGNQINVNINENGTVQVEDMGQGFPINVVRQEDGKTVLEASASVMNTSGKFSDDGVYEGTSLGLNGMGMKLTNFLSEWFEIVSHNSKGEYEHLWFKDGLFEKREVGTGFDWSGTTVTYKPDKQFFDTDKTDIRFFEEFFNDICCLCPRLTVVLNNKQISHPGGIEEILPRKIDKNVEIINNPMTLVANQINKKELDLALTFTSSGTSAIIPYVNYGLTDSGPHVTAIKSCITRVFNNWAKENGLLGEKEKNLDGSSIQEGMVLVCNIISPNVSYDAQVKSRVAKMETSWIAEILSQELELWLDNNPEDAKIIIDKALLARRAAEAAKKAREAVKNKAAKTKLKIAAMPSKLADCHSKKRQECELYLTEGDSASGGAKIIRDASFQAILGLRGKVLNALVADRNRILKNPEIMDIVKALGLSWAEYDKHVIYDEQKLRYGKIVIAADKDSDGGHIQTLLLTLFWTLMPDLILDGHVYIALPPLYKAEWDKKYQYLADKKELEEFKKTHQNFTLTYFKGLGEASPEELGRMILNPETRNIQQVTVEDVGLATMTFEDLMGSDSKPKKEFVFGHAITEIM